ncbi:MAG: hypothetical protein JWP04_2656 [Belnapia sp.]|nr:hypothetical protein [Belnapia sp.]
MPFDQLLGTVWRAKFSLLAAAILAGALGFIGARLAPVRFLGEGQLLVESREPVIPELSQGGVAAAGPVGLVRVRTEADIIRSRRLAEEVVRSLDLTDALTSTLAGQAAPATEGWRDWLLAWPRAGRTALLALLGVEPAPEPVEDRLSEAVTEVRKSLDVRTADNSSVITLRFVAPSPVLAAAVVNAAMERYLALDLAAKEETTAQANRWLTERLVALRAEVETADQRVQALLRQFGLTQTSLGSTDALAVREEQDRSATARQDVSRAQSALDSALRPGRGGAAQALSSPAIQNLLEREGEILQRAAGLAQRLGDRHPDRLAAEGELRGIRRQIEIETGKVVATLQRDLDAARIRLADAERALVTARGSARSSRDAEVMLSQLQREADARRQIYQAFLTRVEQTRLSSAQFASARIISPAPVPSRPAGLPTGIMVLFASFAGLLLATAIVVLRRATDGTVGSVGELVMLTGRPNAASLPRLRGGNRNGMATQVLDDSQSDVAETLRGLRIKLQSVAPSGSGCCALVVSSEVGDGKTTLSASLARLAAADGMRVLIIEADMRRPRLAQVLGVVQSGPGLEAVLEGRSNVADAVLIDDRSGLHCLLADRSARHPQVLLQSAAFGELLQAARQRYDFVVIDSPPIMHVADALSLAPLSDAVLFAVAWKRNTRRMVAAAIQRLPEAVRARTATVFTQVRRGRLDPLDYYHGYSGSAPPSPRLIR